MSLLAATQVTALATVLLAIGVIITAVLAGLAFRKQSEEVRLLGRQLEEQHRDLSQRERLLERQQASAVDLQVWPSKYLPKKPPICMALVSNRSDRPIREVRCRIELGEKQEPYIMTWLGAQLERDNNSERLGTWERFGYGEPVIARGSTHAFEFDFSSDPEASFAISARFIDDAGLHWQIDPDLHLEKLEDRTDW